MDALFFRGRRTRRIMRSTEVVRGGVDAEGTSPSAVPDSPSHISSTRSARTGQSSERSLTRSPPTPTPVTPARRADAGMASRAVLHPKRRAASPPSPGTSPGTGTSPPVTPQSLPIPARKRHLEGRARPPPARRVARRNLRLVPIRNQHDRKNPTRRAKVCAKPRKKRSRGARKKHSRRRRRPPRSAEVEKTSKTSAAKRRARKRT